MADDAVKSEQPEPGAPPFSNRGDPDRAAPPLRRDTTRDDETCWVCGAPTVYRKCKIICTVCGFMRDCSDS